MLAHSRQLRGKCSADTAEEGVRGRWDRLRPALAGVILAVAFVHARAGIIRTYFMVTAAVVRTHRSRVAVQPFTLRPVSGGLR